MTNTGKYLIVGFLGIVAGGVLGSVVEIITGNSNSGIARIFAQIGGGIAASLNINLNHSLKRGRCRKRLPTETQKRGQHG